MEENRKKTYLSADMVHYFVDGSLYGCARRNIFKRLGDEHFSLYQLCDVFLYTYSVMYCLLEGISGTVQSDKRKNA